MPTRGVVKFGQFEANLWARELRRQGSKVRLPDQSFQVLALLLSHPGELVAREDIRRRLWPDDTFVDFDHGLNNAVNRLREALGDSADVPGFIETLPRRGYRFIGTVNGSATRERVPVVDSGTKHVPAADPGSLETSTSTAYTTSPGRIAVVAAVSLILLLAFGLHFLRRGELAAAPIRSLVVLPLDNLSGDPHRIILLTG